MQLRPYQQAAKAAVYQHLRSKNNNPCVVVPTAGGKTPLMASICEDAVGPWNGRVLILSHVKELIEQTADKLRRVCPEVDFGIHSAGLGRRDIDQPVILAGIQSVYERAREMGSFDLVFVDEAHLIPREGDGMYRSFLDTAKLVNPGLRVIGFTATPFRLKTGPICTPDGTLNDICFEVGVADLIRDGYLCPPVSKAAREKPDLTGLRLFAGEYLNFELESLMVEDSIVRSACSEIVAYMADRNGCLIFSAGLGHGRQIVAALRRDHGLDCGFVTGETPTAERAATLDRFRSGELKYLCNVNVLTTGFDDPHIDCIALLRPTMSPGLYYQMVGRGFRMHPGKRDCLVLDFGGNVLRHGPVDELRIATPGAGNGQAPAKECPACQGLISAGFATCPQCGHQFATWQRLHAPQASYEPILTGESATRWYRVQGVAYSVHRKHGAAEDAPKSLRVDYRILLNDYISEWICFEHNGFAREKAADWWRRRSPLPVPDTAQRAIELINREGLAPPLCIQVRFVRGESHGRIIKHELGLVSAARVTF
jgi:DNA repair protein RadD